MEQAKERVRAWKGGMLDLRNLGLTELPELPTGLEILYCSKNRLSSLPDILPATLICIRCDKNKLTTLPDTLPAELRYLVCGQNELTTLPDTLPIDLEELRCDYNNFPRREYEESIPVYVARVNATAEAASRERIMQRCALVFEELVQTLHV
jgi:hypothetical protein